MKAKAFLLFSIIILIVMAIPFVQVHAQTCFDPSGGPIPCPTEIPVRRTPRPTQTIATSTFTATATFTFTYTPTSTFTQTLTSTPTITSTATITSTNTATFTSTPPAVTMAVLPGAGIGFFILLIILGILLPLGQKIKTTKRGY